MTHSSAGGISSLNEVTWNTINISEYLDFGFYDRVWYHENAVLGPALPKRWFGVFHWLEKLMCYHILTQKAMIISRSTVQQVKDLELETDSIRRF